MTDLQRQVRAAQRRLWLIRWFYCLNLCVGVAAACYACVILTARLFDVHSQLPLAWTALGLSAAPVVASLAWSYATRPDAAFAATALDQAAGLRERISSGHYCRADDDPFAAAVVADAERISGSLSVRTHLRLGAPASLPFATGSVLLAALMFLVPPGLLKDAEAKQADERRQELDTTQVAVKRQFDALREKVEASPALEEVKEELQLVDPKAGGAIRKPEEIRHNAAKKLDDLSDMVKQKQERAEYGATKEMEKMLRGLKPLGPTESPTNRLSEALAEGDFKTAREQTEAIKEQLATLKSEQDKEMVEKLSKQLEELAEQIEKLAKNEKLAEKLEQAGLSPEDAKRLLENLSKKDLEQLKKTLEEKGLSKEQIEKIAKQMQQRQQTGKMAKQMAQAMKKAAQAANAGQAGDAASGLSMAADQLSELEQLQQEIAQLDAAASAINDAQSALDKPCPHCKGSGTRGGRPCGRCQGTGGMGPKGQGRGGLAPEQQANMDFKIERGKVQTQKGAIIGQFFVEGEQVKGQVSRSFAKIVTASEREASDRINRDRIPRQYQKAIKEYFSQVRKEYPSVETIEPAQNASPSSQAGSDPSTDGNQDKD